MERILANKALREENIALKELLNDRHEGFFDVFIVHSEPMRAIFAKIEEVALSSAPILITGETGCW